MSSRSSADVARDERIATALAQSAPVVTSATLSQAQWWIDPQNRTGLASNRNDGKTATTPLLTHAEFERRIGHFNTLNPPAVVWSGFGPVPFPVLRIYIMSDMNIDDPANLLVVAPPNLAIMYLGSPGITVLASGHLTAVSNFDPTINTATTATDSARLASWASAIGLTRLTAQTFDSELGRIVPTSAWPIKDLGGHTVRVTNWATTGGLEDPDNFVDNWAPIVGDPYVVEQLPKMWFGACSIVAQQTTNDVYGVFSFVVRDGWVRASNGSRSVIGFMQAVAAPQFVGCIIEPSLLGNSPAFTITRAANCLCTPGLSTGGSPGGVGLNGTVILDAGGSLGSYIAVQSAELWIDQDYTVQDCWIFVGANGSLFVDGLGIFDGPSHGIQVGGNSFDAVLSGAGQLVVQNIEHDTARVWGSGNNGYGVYLGNNCTASIETPAWMTVTGTSGDFSLGGAANARAFDESTGAYTTIRTQTWAHYIASVAGGGFGANVHDLTRNIHMTQQTG